MLGLSLVMQGPASQSSSESLSLDVPFFTTRGISIDGQGNNRYSNEIGPVSAGHCRVDLQQGKKLKALNVSLHARSSKALMADLAEHADAGILVYVHGYNTSHQRACREAALVAYRTGFEGRLALLSWPASRAVVTYRKDEQRFAKSLPAMLKILEDLGAVAGYDAVNIVAHSMGSRLALSELPASSTGQRFDDLILIAPDIDRDAFREAIPRLQQRVNNISLLVSESDRLLLISQLVNLGERLGQADDFRAPDVAVVDVSDLEGLGFSGHVYHLINDRVSDILKAILATEPDP